MCGDGGGGGEGVCEPAYELTDTPPGSSVSATYTDANYCDDADFFGGSDNASDWP